MCFNVQLCSCVSVFFASVCVRERESEHFCVRVANRTKGVCRWYAVLSHLILAIDDLMSSGLMEQQV